LDSICDQYIKNLESGDCIKSFDTLQQHGWVSFANGIEISPDNATRLAQLIQLIEKSPIEIVRLLAYCKDLQGRIAMDGAPKEIRTAMEKRILFLGRFELTKGPPLHKSSTSLVIKAIDRGAEDAYRQAFEMAALQLNKFIGELEVLLDNLGCDQEVFEGQFENWTLDSDGIISEDDCVELLKREIDNGVVLKFMRNTEQFRREVDFRNDLKFDSNYVVGVSDIFSSENDNKFASALKLFSKDGGLDLREYKHAIVMSFADRTLDAIFRCM
jgi:hypothetical protein